MSNTGFLPRKDADLLAWSQNFHSVLAAGPGSFGVTEGDVTLLNTKRNDFVAKMELVEPTVRNKASTALKNESRENLVSYIKSLALQIYGHIGITDAQLIELGLTVRKNPTPSPVPEFAPLINVTSVSGTVAIILLRDSQQPSKRGRPARVAGANVFKFVGENPPENFNQWEFAGPVNKTRFELDLGATLAPATRVWITACWVNPKSQTGPLSDPIFAYTQAGGTMYQYGVMKMAA